MPRSELVVALDVGTTKVCTLVGEVTGEDQIEILGVGMSQSTGMRKGVVVDISDTAASIRESVEQAEKMARVTIATVYAGLTGAHIESRNSIGKVSVDKEIKDEDVQAARLAARQLLLPPDREIIHNISRGFVVDGQEGVRHPVGMSAAVLEVETHVVTASTGCVENLSKSIERANLQIDEIVVEPLATGLAVLTETERQLGVVLADIGGGTTDVALWFDGAITHSTVIPIGGNHVTKDLSIFLRLTGEDAERLKVEQGAARIVDVRPSEYVEIQMVGEPEPREIPRELIAQIVEPRMSELFQELAKHVAVAARDGIYASTCVLSGGGSQLEGGVELAQQIMGMPVRIGRPREIIDPRGLVESPVYATAVGLLHYAAERISGRKRVREPRSLPAAAYRLLTQWFARLGRG